MVQCAIPAEKPLVLPESPLASGERPSPQAWEAVEDEGAKTCLETDPLGQLASPFSSSKIS